MGVNTWLFVRARLEWVAISSHRIYAKAAWDWQDWSASKYSVHADALLFEALRQSMKCWFCSVHAEAAGAAGAAAGAGALLPPPEKESAAAFTALCAMAEPPPKAMPETIVPINPDIMPPPCGAAGAGAGAAGAGAGGGGARAGGGGARAVLAGREGGAREGGARAGEDPPRELLNARCVNRRRVQKSVLELR